MRYARVEDGIVREMVEGDPWIIEKLYTQEFLETLVPNAPDECAEWWVHQDGIFHPPSPGDTYVLVGGTWVQDQAKIAALARRRAMSRLSAIDLETVRPLRAKLAGTATLEDDAILAELEAEAVSLRSQISPA